ncbi:class I/II aminotransferase (macronuclear) [Tetrahymena thermophila SB210]|uniref:Class I/II aminotransferase n=1 Tax=Tetrahymena thermophila (strain SB210) TaxID=312017 RepID=I7M2D0_TETTS|nr:class I/II aminotransferase [Tetrahymena thermophila SB210]EAR99872.2 class I/II aminotransferase [Tetrahymena thermophila SB210]|eukprot:XP_001020117.2 class I/II aminotransferase [Tetrahymena thermophila SB210]
MIGNLVKNYKNLKAFNLLKQFIPKGFSTQKKMSLDSQIDIQPSKFMQKLINPTIFELIVPLSQKYQSINLASGFPDWETPEFLCNAVTEAFKLPEHQYAPVGGHPALIQKLCERYSKSLNRNILPQNISVGLGGSGVIYDIYTAFLNEGDELIVFEPFFEYHSKEAKLLGVNVKACSLIEPEDFENGEWQIDFKQFESLINDKTRMIVLNSPHNPTGKVFTREEYQKIADIVKKYPKVLVLADDVYETLIYDNKEFPRFVDIPGMFERTLQVFSLGKLFSCTGWRIGFCIGPEQFIKIVRATHAIICYSVHRPVQIGFAKALDEAKSKYMGTDDNYEVNIRKRFEKNRNVILEGFKNLNANLKLNKPQGGYFIVGSLKDHVGKIPRKYFFKDFENVPDGDALLGDTPFEEFEQAEVTPDVAFFKYMIIEKGVTVIPMSSFYIQDDEKNLKNIKGRYFFRIALPRKEETINSAFKKLNQTLKQN